MAPRKEPALATVFSDLEKSYSFNCASVLDAAAAQIGEVRLPLVAGITSKNHLWTILHKYKTVCLSLESRLALLSVVTDFCMGCVVTPAIVDLFFHDSVSNTVSLHALFSKLGEEWSSVFLAVLSLPKSKWLQECKIKAVHNIFTRWSEKMDSILISKLMSKASETCFKMYGLKAVEAATSNKSSAEKMIANEEDGETSALLNIKFELKLLRVGSLQLKTGKDQLLQLYLGEEIVLGIDPARKPEIGISLTEEHLDHVVVCFGDGDSLCDVRDVLFLYPNSAGCSVITQALARVCDGDPPPPLVSMKGEDRRVVAHCKRRIKDQGAGDVMELLRRLVPDKVKEVDLEFSQALINKTQKAARLFSSDINENHKRGRYQDKESFRTDKDIKFLKKDTDQTMQENRPVENIRLRCFMCGHETGDRKKLNVHILTHFTKEFHKRLQRFNCPLCKYKSIDRKDLTYHYAFVHEKILDFVTKEQLAGAVEAKINISKSLTDSCSNQTFVSQSRSPFAPRSPSPFAQSSSPFKPQSPSSVVQASSTLSQISPNSVAQASSPLSPRSNSVAQVSSPFISRSPRSVAQASSPLSPRSHSSVDQSSSPFSLSSVAKSSSPRSLSSVAQSSSPRSLSSVAQASSPRSLSSVAQASSPRSPSSPYSSRSSPVALAIPNFSLRSPSPVSQAGLSFRSQSPSPVTKAIPSSNTPSSPQCGSPNSVPRSITPSSSRSGSPNSVPRSKTPSSRSGSPSSAPRTRTPSSSRSGSPNSVPRSKTPSSRSGSPSSSPRTRTPSSSLSVSLNSIPRSKTPPSSRSGSPNSVRRSRTPSSSRSGSPNSDRRSKSHSSSRSGSPNSVPCARTPSSSRSGSQNSIPRSKTPSSSRSGSLNSVPQSKTPSSSRSPSPDSVPRSRSPSMLQSPCPGSNSKHKSPSSSRSPSHVFAPLSSIPRPSPVTAPQSNPSPLRSIRCGCDDCRFTNSNHWATLKAKGLLNHNCHVCQLQREKIEWTKTAIASLKQGLLDCFCEDCVNFTNLTEFHITVACMCHPCRINRHIEAVEAGTEIPRTVQDFQHPITFTGTGISINDISEAEEKCLTLSCKMVRIGSYPVCPQDDQVLLNSSHLEMVVLDAFQVSAVPVRIDVTEIQSAFVSFSEALPLLVLHLTPVACAIIMKILAMDHEILKIGRNESVFCIDSNSPNESERRMIICLEKITEAAEEALRSFTKDVTELSEVEAQDILVRSGHVIAKDESNLQNQVLYDEVEESSPTLKRKGIFCRSFAKEVKEEPRVQVNQNESIKLVGSSDQQNTPKQNVDLAKEQNPEITKNDGLTDLLNNDCNCDDCKFTNPKHWETLKAKGILNHHCHVCQRQRHKIKQNQRKQLEVKAMNEEEEINKNKIIPWKLVPIQEYEGDNYWCEPWIDDLLRDIKDGKVSITSAAAMTGTSYGIVYNKYVKMFGKINPCN